MQNNIFWGVFEVLYVRSSTLLKSVAVRMIYS